VGAGLEGLDEVAGGVCEEGLLDGRAGVHEDEREAAAGLAGGGDPGAVLGFGDLPGVFGGGGVDGLLDGFG
jgi:hypothetical protein